MCVIIPLLLTYLSINLVGVFLVDNLFNGGGDENVTLLVQHVLTFVGLSSRETNNCAVLVSIVFQSLQ